MNGRERVQAAMQYKAVDKVPLQYYYCPVGYFEHGEKLNELYATAPGDFEPFCRMPIVGPQPHEIDEDGNPMFTDLILEDPNGYGNMAVYAIFTNNNDNPFYFMMERTSLTYDNEVQATIFDTWLSNMTSEYVQDYDLDTDEWIGYTVVIREKGE